MNEFDPCDHEARQPLMRHHPLVTNEFTTYTPSIPKVIGIVLDAVMLHKKSICFNALPQMGKTKILHSCVAALEGHQDYQDRLIIKISVDPFKHENVIRNLFRTFGLEMPKIFNLDLAREDVIATINGRLKLIGGRHVVFFIDEMQALKNDDFECLRFLQNELAVRNISMTVIGFAQSDIEVCLNNLRKSGRPELIIRFLNEVVAVPFCDSEEWIRLTIAPYDDLLTYPVGSQCTYTRFFLPMAYEAGFRLANHAHEIFVALDEERVSSSLPCIPTVCAFEVFRLILYRAHERDSSFFTLDAKSLAKAIQECQIAGYAANLKKASAGHANVAE
ncbi:ATP-binding protein [Pseudomonas silesiensis]|uniref:ATP-binding protein n=3 Tax=Pseudomonas TaxID=286 RepID=UPI0034D7136E